MPFATRPVWLVALIVLLLCGVLDTSDMRRSSPALSRQSAETTMRVQAMPVEPLGTSCGFVPRRTAVDGSSPAAGVHLLEASVSWLRRSRMDAPRFCLRI